MASIKVKFRPSAVDGHEGTLYYQIIHDRRARQILSHHKIFPAEWDGIKITIRPTSARRELLLGIRREICCDIERLQKIIKNLDDKGLTYMAEDVIAAYEEYMNEMSLSGFMRRAVYKLQLNGQMRTAETYTAALNSFMNFRAGEEIMLDSLSCEVMEEYESWLKKRGVAMNTISFYTRILRAVYNKAVDSGKIENRYPFRHVYTGIAKTVKRALPIAIIKQIKGLDLRLQPGLDYARDMFLMSFMLRGMSFIDMSYLRKSDLIDGHIIYRRRKTGQRLIIQWTKEMQHILNKYPQNDSPYLLPIIRNTVKNERFTYRNVGYNINRNLKTIARQIGVGIPLTLYVARHSWASAAKAKGIPLSVISEGMGHDSETTTQIYLASLDTSVIDKANSLILASIN